MFPRWKRWLYWPCSVKSPLKISKNVDRTHSRGGKETRGNLHEIAEELQQKN